MAIFRYGTAREHKVSPRKNLDALPRMCAAAPGFRASHATDGEGGDVRATRKPVFICPKGVNVDLPLDGYRCPGLAPQSRTFPEYSWAARLPCGEAPLQCTPLPHAGLAILLRPQEKQERQGSAWHSPQQLVAPLEDYLKCARPVLVNGNDPHTLFVSDVGGRYTSGNLRTRVGNLSVRYTGRDVNPHLFRDTFALRYLEDQSLNFMKLSTILWHLSPGVATGIYGRKFDASQGSRVVEEWLDSLEERSSKKS